MWYEIRCCEAGSTTRRNASVFGAHDIHGGMRVDQEQHRASQPHAAQHVGQNVEAGRRGMRSGRSVMVSVHGVVDATGAALALKEHASE